MNIFLSILLLVLGLFLSLKFFFLDGPKKEVYDELAWIGKTEINITWVGVYMPPISFFFSDRTRLGSIFRVTYKNVDGKDFTGHCAVYWMSFEGFQTKWLNS